MNDTLESNPRLAGSELSSTYQAKAVMVGLMAKRKIYSIKFLTDETLEMALFVGKDR